jgi:hypothetical protein
MKSSFPLLFFICLHGWIQGQETQQEPAKKKTKIDHVQISLGGELSTAPLLMSQADFMKLAPTAQLYPSGPVEDIRMGMMTSWNASLFNIQLGGSPTLKESGEKSTHRAWRIGLMGQSFQSNLYSSIVETTYRVDTLYQGSSGSIYGFIDSTERSFSNGYYQATTLKLDGSHIWSTGFDKRFNLYTGIGGNAGINLSPRTEIVNNRWNSMDVVDKDGVMISSSGNFNANFDFQRETFRNQTGFAASAYIPIGLDFRIGQKRAYLKNLHVFSELRPTLHWTYVPETRSYLFPTFQSTVGMKWCW